LQHYFLHYNEKRLPGQQARSVKKWNLYLAVIIENNLLSNANALFFILKLPGCTNTFAPIAYL